MAPAALEKLRAEMNSQFEKLRAEMNFQFEKLQEENERLSFRVETLEKEKAELEKEKSVLPPKAPAAEEKDPSSKKYPIREEPIFQAKTLLQRSTFFTAKSMAVFIRSGIIGKLIIETPMKKKYVSLNDKREYLPDLVEEIIVTHILAEMGTAEDSKAGNERGKEFRERERVDIRKFDCTGLPKKDQKDITNSSLMIGRIRRLDWETIYNIVKELMKLI